MRLKNVLVPFFNERFYNHFFYYYNHLKKGILPKRLNLKDPVTFNEKTIWLKLYQRDELACVVADKVLVKDYVKGLIGEQYLIPTIGVYSSPSDIDFDELPEAFVLKANHGSAWNIICPRKGELDFDFVRKSLTEWLNTNYYSIGKEYQYREIQPKIICEHYLDSCQECLVDYKFFCFSGKPVFVQVDLDRHTNHRRNFYDLEWNLMPFTTMYPMGPGQHPRPTGLSEMICIAEKLSTNFKFARIDLYYHKSRVYFGEITLHHGGGFEPFMPQDFDRILGNYLLLADGHCGGS